jgi:hypothetical protein
MLERLQQIIRRTPAGLWLLLVALLFVQVLPLHFHNHAAGQEPAVAHHHNVMSYLDDGVDDIADSQLQTVNLELHGLYQSGDMDMPVLLFVLLLLLTLGICYRYRRISPSYSPLSYSSCSYRLPPLRAPPIH